MSKKQDIHKVLIIGSGPIIIGQACEFDYSGTQACKALKKLGYEIVLVNSNPATIMTDPGTADVRKKGQTRFFRIWEDSPVLISVQNWRRPAFWTNMAFRSLAFR